MGTTRRRDRFLLVLLALLLAAAGGLALAVGVGGFGSRLSSRPVFDNEVGRYVGDNGVWLWPVLALVGLLLGLLAVRWLIAQLRPTGVGELALEPGATRGHTDLLAGAVTDAVREEIDGYRGVSRVSARLVGDPGDPLLTLRVHLDARADVGAVRQRIEGTAVARARQALDRPQLPVRLDLVVTTRTAARVS